MSVDLVKFEKVLLGLVFELRHQVVIRDVRHVDFGALQGIHESISVLSLVLGLILLRPKNVVVDIFRLNHPWYVISGSSEAVAIHLTSLGEYCLVTLILTRVDLWLISVGWADSNRSLSRDSNTRGLSCVDRKPGICESSNRRRLDTSVDASTL